MITEEKLLEALQGDADAVRTLLDQINGVPSATQEQVAARAGQQRADFRHAADKFLEEYGDLQDDPKIWQAVMECDKALAERYPDASYEERLAVVGQTARRKFGTPESRVIKEMQAQRRNQQAPDPLSYEVPDDDSTDFDRDHSAGIAEAIEQARNARGGVRLSEIRKRAGGSEE